MFFSDLDAFWAPRAHHGAPRWLPGAFLQDFRFGNKFGSQFAKKTKEIPKNVQTRWPRNKLHEQRMATHSTTRQLGTHSRKWHNGTRARKKNNSKENNHLPRRVHEQQMTTSFATEQVSKHLSRTLVKQIISFFNVRQGQNETEDDYLVRFNAKKRSLEMMVGEHIFVSPLIMG